MGYFPYSRLIKRCGDRRQATFRQKKPRMADSTPLRARRSGTGSAANAAGTCEDGLRPASVNDESGHHRSIVGRILATGSDIDEDDLDMDAVRRRILARVKESRSDLRMASRAIGRNAAYLHQFIHRGMPRVLVEHLGCSPEELRHDRSPSGDLQPRQPLAVPRGLLRGPRDRRSCHRGPGGLERGSRADHPA